MSTLARGERRAAGARAQRLAAMFGVAAGGDRAERERREASAGEAARRLDELLRAGEVALVTGVSGCGKTMVLRALAALLEREGRAVVGVGLGCGVGRAARRGRTAIELVGGPIDEAARVLAGAGLADAGALVRPARELSEGQRARVELAIGMSRALRAGRGGAAPTLVVDELCTALDRPTAACVARMVRRWAGRAGVRVVGASAHDDLLEPLGPDVLVVPGEEEPALVRRRDGAS